MEELVNIVHININIRIIHVGSKTSLDPFLAVGKVMRCLILSIAVTLVLHNL